MLLLRGDEVSRQEDGAVYLHIRLAISTPIIDPETGKLGRVCGVEATLDFGIHGAEKSFMRATSYGCTIRRSDSAFLAQA